ncbi:MAG: hypothetical protein WBD63_09225 [Phycisphaerae bacterium]|nr:hypothetical protein [Phycisphaerae bacterium]
MSNESYLVVSYFAAAGAGVLLAVLTALFLSAPLSKALARVARPLGTVFRRFLPSWLILAVLLGFLSVTYYDCSHGTYQKIVADRHHLVQKNFEQGAGITQYLATALAAYGLVLGLSLLGGARNSSAPDRQPPDRAP